MKKMIFLMSLLLFFLPFSVSALEENQIEPVMQKNIDIVLSILNDRNMTKAQRNAKIEKVMDPYFDFTLMAKLSLGKSGWESATPAQRKPSGSLISPFSS